MNHFKTLALTVILIILAAGCSRTRYERLIIGTWELTGALCDTEGRCKKEIITDEGGRETFTADGLYLSGRMRTGYAVKGDRIWLSSGRGSFDAPHADIVSLESGVMLLRGEDGIRRYGQVEEEKKPR